MTRRFRRIQSQRRPVGECLGPDGKALRKTFGEVREDARRDILSAADREKFEELDPDEREYVDQVCLFESKSQKVSRQSHKVKLREILLCRDIAQAYCPGRDMIGQYSEGKRILKNSETGSDSVKFVLARKVCSMMDKINTIYSSNAQSYVRGDLHRLETELLNYLNRLGRMIREPLSEARRVYSKLRERAGWNFPNTAFAIAEDCDVPQIFFNRYSSPAQLLLKDPKKPFRSDNVSPPLKLDFRIKNAVLIVAGENRFHLDRARFEKVRTAGREAYRHVQPSGRQGQDRRSISQEPVPPGGGVLAAGRDQRADDQGELLRLFLLLHPEKPAQQRLPRRFGRAVHARSDERGERTRMSRVLSFHLSPWRGDDPPEASAWSLSSTRALELRRLFHEISEQKIRLSMFPTRMTYCSPPTWRNSSGGCARL